MMKKLFIYSIIFVYSTSLVAITYNDSNSKKSIERCKKQNELLNSFEKDFIQDIINSKPGDFKDLKDENRKDKMKECE